MQKYENHPTEVRRRINLPASGNNRELLGFFYTALELAYTALVKAGRTLWVISHTSYTFPC